MFKKLGLRYVLVSQRGVLSGIITKKDILQHIRSTEGKKMKRRSANDPEIYDLKVLKQGMD